MRNGVSHISALARTVEIDLLHNTNDLVKGEIFVLFLIAKLVFFIKFDIYFKNLQIYIIVL